MPPSAAKNSAVAASAASKRRSPVAGGSAAISALRPGRLEPRKSSAKPNSNRIAFRSSPPARSWRMVVARFANGAAPRRMRGRATRSASWSQAARSRSNVARLGLRAPVSYAATADCAVRARFATASCVSCARCLASLRRLAVLIVLLRSVYWQRLSATYPNLRLPAGVRLCLGQITRGRTMPTFHISSHGRLQDWIAVGKGYFTDAGLDFQFNVKIQENAEQDIDAATGDGDVRVGAYELYKAQAGGKRDMSCACHWAVNQSAVEQAGRMWGRAYSVLPCAIYVPADSEIRTPADLAGVPVAVGYHSGSHFTTIQALEAYLKPDAIELSYMGMPWDRVDALLGGCL